MKFFLLLTTAIVAVVASYFIFTRCAICINLVWMNATVIRSATDLPVFPLAILMVILSTLFIWRVLWILCRLFNAAVDYLIES